MLKPEATFLIRFLVRLPCRESATEEMSIDDVAQVRFGAFTLGHHLFHEIVQATDVEPTMMMMHIVVIVAHVAVIAPVVKDTHLQGPIG